MRGKNTKSKNTQSFTSFNHSFNTGNMLSHPSGMTTFKEKAGEVKKERQEKKDILMLNKSPHFKKREQNEDDSDTDIENVDSTPKRYQKTTLCSVIDGHRNFTTLLVQRQGKQYSQLDNDYPASRRRNSRNYERNVENPEDNRRKMEEINRQEQRKKAEKKKVEKPRSPEQKKKINKMLSEQDFDEYGQLIDENNRQYLP